jgi:hypothetical protein
MKSKLGMLGIFSTLVISSSAAAGVTVTIQDTKDKQDTKDDQDTNENQANKENQANRDNQGAKKTKGKDKNMVLYFEGNKMRIESPDRKDSAMIYDGDAQKMIVIEPERKSYSEMTPESVKATMDQASKKMQAEMGKMTPEQRKQMDEALANMDPESRKRMEAMMSGKGGSTPNSPAKTEAKKENVKWEQTGRQQTVAGYRCKGFKELRNGKLEAQGCLIPWDAGALTKADLAPMMKMESFMSQTGWGSSSSGRFGWKELQEMPGFPGMWSSLGDNGEVESTHTVTSVKRGAISGDKFQPPAGFKKVDINKMGAD